MGKYIQKKGEDMDNTTYDRYKDALDAAKDSGDKEMLEKIKARAIADHGSDEDVDLLFKYHT